MPDSRPILPATRFLVVLELFVWREDRLQVSAEFAFFWRACWWRCGSCTDVHHHHHHNTHFSARPRTICSIHNRLVCLTYIVHHRCDVLVYIWWSDCCSGVNLRYRHYSRLGVVVDHAG